MINYKYITIIIPTHNSEKTLPLTLESIVKTIYDKKYVKVVIVDDYSDAVSYTHLTLPTN